MANKKTLEELRAELEAVTKAYNKAKEEEAKIRAEEEAARIAKLQSEKEARYKEVIAAYEKFEELKNAFVKDYGYFTFHSTNGPSASATWLIDFFS